MDVLVKNVSMPNHCLECWNCDKNFTSPNLGVIENWICLLRMKFVPADKRPDWCPLVEVEPHGRLIDADALLDELLPDPILECGCPDPEGIEEFCDWIDSAPTVIEGSKNEQIR